MLWTWRKLREEQDRLDEERGGGYDYDICGDFPVAHHKKRVHILWHHLSTKTRDITERMYCVQNHEKKCRPKSS